MENIERKSLEERTAIRGSCLYCGQTLYIANLVTQRRTCVGHLKDKVFLDAAKKLCPQSPDSKHLVLG